MSKNEHAVGTLSYGGYTFPSDFTAKIVCRPEYDIADRGVKYISHTLTVDVIITGDDAPQSTAGATVNSNLTTIKTTLLSPGRQLVFSDQGFGNIDVARSTNDSQFGPKPRLLTWESIGSNKAVRVLWQVDFFLPYCSNTPSYRGAFAEFTYETSWTINERGLTTRTFHATMEVPIGTAGRIPTDMADKYREHFNPDVPLGFHREWHIQESRDKRVLDISVIDTEIDSDRPFPEGFTHIDVRHTINSDLYNRGFTMWNSTISGHIKVAPGYSRIKAWQAFRVIVADRFRQGRSTIGLKGMKDSPKSVVESAILESISVEESLFSRELMFDVTWFFVSPLSQAFARSGMFTAVPETNWNRWRTSMANVHSPRGVAGMASKVGDDIIVDLCAFDKPYPNSDITQNLPTGSDYALEYACPPKEASYIQFDAYFRLTEKSNLIQHSKLTPASLQDYIKANATDSNPSATGYYPSQVTDGGSPSSQESHYIQVRGKTLPYLEFFGIAKRLCYKIPVPQIAEAGGVTPALIKSVANPYIISVSNDTPIHGLVWYNAYALNTVPNGEFFETLKTEGIPEGYGVKKL